MRTELLSKASFRGKAVLEKESTNRATISTLHSEEFCDWNLSPKRRLHQVSPFLGYLYRTLKLVVTEKKFRVTKQKRVSRR